MTPLVVTPTPSPTNLSNLTESDLGPIPGVLSFIAFVLLAVAIVVIFRSMSKQLKRIDFPEDGQGPADVVDEPPPSSS